VDRDVSKIVDRDPPILIDWVDELESLVSFCRTRNSGLPNQTMSFKAFLSVTQISVLLKPKPTEGKRLTASPMMLLMKIARAPEGMSALYSEMGFLFTFLYSRLRISPSRLANSSEAGNDYF
jgi:hypothetical protein